MADFEVLHVVPAVPGGGIDISFGGLDFTVDRDLKPWKDPVGPYGQPSRIRPHPGQPQLYREKPVTEQVLLLAVVGGAALDDASLGGRLFTPFLAEGIGPPHFALPAAGYSCLVRFTPISGGHHCIGMRRPIGGAVLVHLDIGAAV